ncbi:phenylacetic acid degradation operon negative regulatory protein PaaX [Azospirillum sp. RWY-5-1]|uniref:Phenylacetic acid degradation operon negative regulatory protein PaaX n=1 Tax=Azospirillum oleiclasticum TaxID=2735135 RepID=A0ABX2TER8_9PROT|nr:phenylacetic acid degradation operon negative regulatory protein PaaX [Azospirillum oleiclasticum]NYZ14991.1 phenylacetic acid degradation operon negative regulatory protein PaaX [Azospirillum oleiclasticum]NYZ22753.1 phenylacetic acid degradation operon negative regulatory protein PaaX [Azospirillum oleiclasticum]
MARSRKAEGLVASLTVAVAPRAKSLIVTIYGDAVLPHGGSVWLGSLIELMGEFGMGERIVRTSVFRLCRDDLLTNTQVGRRSYYRITEGGLERFHAAERRIYAPQDRPWDGGWHMLLIGASTIEPETRERLKSELVWLGFGTVSPTVLTHPCCDEPAVRRLLADLGVADRVVLMKASQDQGGGLPALRELVRGCWDLDRLETDYAAYLARYRPVWQALDGAEPEPRAAFLLRTLLIHDFRRILLRDPMLPAPLLPPDWSGNAARTLTRNLYRLLKRPSEAFVMATLKTADGPLPEVEPGFEERFGGLGEAEGWTRAAE